MGLFQKNKSSKKSGDEFPEYVNNLLKDSQAISNEEIDEQFSVETMAMRTNYGIDHAVALMRDLPKDASPVIVSTVTKTLESARIDVSRIIEDAQNKETALSDQINQLNSEIDSLNAQIAQKKDQINDASKILKETQHVKGLLESGKIKNTPTDISASRKKKEPKVNAVPESEAVKMALEAQ